MGPPPLPLGTTRADSGVPWETRREGRILSALIETTTEVLLHPTEFFRAMPVTGGMGAPFGYAVILGYAGLLAQAVYQAFLRIGFGSLLAGLGRRGEVGQLLAMAQGGVGFIAQVIMGPVLVIVGLFVGAGIYHLMLLLLGGARRDFEATFRVVAYAHAASALLAIPICGNVAAFVWGLVAVVIGLAEAHGIGRGKALAAVVLPILLVCCCCGALFGVFVAGIGGLASLARFVR